MWEMEEEFLLSMLGDLNSVSTLKCKLERGGRHPRDQEESWKFSMNREEKLPCHKLHI